jgi:hypothetical protein
MSSRAVLACAAWALAACSTPAAWAASSKLVVVELFTSQGCSSCPPANANLITLSKRPGVLALSFGVTYWDYLGWKDIFARPDYTDRQARYEPRLGRSGPFTPQIVVNGNADVIGNDLAETSEVIAKSRPANGPDITLTAPSVRIASAAAPEPADIWLVRYDPSVIEVPVRRGENGGRTLPHGHVVRDLVRLGSWTGTAATFPVPPAPAGQRTAVLVQLPRGGPILSAATD